jgi:hypothetical protein
LVHLFLVQYGYLHNWGHDLASMILVEVPQR